VNAQGAAFLGIAEMATSFGVASRLLVVVVDETSSGHPHLTGALETDRWSPAEFVTSGCGLHAVLSSIVMLQWRSK
jgi:hypothetical protein